MLARIGTNQELYGVYYTVFGSLAGEGHLIKNFFWCGPYSQLQLAVYKAAELKISYQNDDSFGVKRYK